MSRIEFFGLEKKECSQCHKMHAISSLYFNRKEGNLWCTHCLGKEKKERNHQQRKKKKGSKLKEDD